jgi:hypothetical protein
MKSERLFLAFNTAESNKIMVSMSNNLFLYLPTFTWTIAFCDKERKERKHYFYVTRQNIKKHLKLLTHSIHHTIFFAVITMGPATSNMGKSTDENLESLSLIWLDANVNISRENLDVQKRLRSTINFLKTFHDVAECEAHIRSVPAGDRVLFIVSGGLGRDIVPRIHMLRQVIAIYVFCSNKQIHEQWTKPYTKVILSFVVIFRIALVDVRRLYKKFLDFILLEVI